MEGSERKSGGSGQPGDGGVTLSCKADPPARGPCLLVVPQVDPRCLGWECEPEPDSLPTFSQSPQESLRPAGALLRLGRVTQPASGHPAR